MVEYVRYNSRIAFCGKRIKGVVVYAFSQPPHQNIRGKLLLGHTGQAKRLEASEEPHH